LRLSEALDRNADEVEKLIILASDFVSRGRPAEVIDAFLRQLFQLAAKCSTKFEDVAITPAGENDGSRIGAALIHGAWGCSIIRNDVSGSVSQFAQNLSVLLAKWPSIARLAHLGLVGVTQRMPLEHQQSVWRGILACRAWS
jgi:predicted component of type VI protein secretion system